MYIYININTKRKQKNTIFVYILPIQMSKISIKYLGKFLQIEIT